MLAPSPSFFSARCPHPLHAARNVVISHYPPHPRWSQTHGTQLRIWPVVCLSLVLFLVSLTFLVYSNHNSQSCDEAVLYEFWTAEREAAGCKMYDVLQDDWRTAMLEDYNELPHLNLVSATASQDFVANPQAPLFQPTTVHDLVNSIPHSGWAAIVLRQIQSVEMPLLVDILGVFSYRDFNLSIHLVGTVPPSDLLLLGVDGAGLTVRARAINWTDPFWELNVTANRENPNRTALIVSWYWAPLQFVVLNQLESTWNAFVETRHIQHCNVCIRESAVSIMWIIVLGTMQAVSLIVSVSGCVLRRCNNEIYEAEQGLLYDHLQAANNVRDYVAPVLHAGHEDVLDSSPGMSAQLLG